MALTYEDIKEPFLEALRNDRRATALITKIEAGKGTYDMASEYAARVGDCLAKVLKARAPYENIDEWDIDNLIPKSLGLDHSIVSYACMNVQETLNKDARLRVKFQEPKFDSDRAYGLVQELRNNPEFTNIEKSFYDQLTNFSQNIVDESIRDNARVLAGAGVRSMVIRHTEFGACEWCDEVAGAYDYDEVSDAGNDVWRRHENCRCTIDFITERNTGFYSERVNNQKK